MIQYWLTGVLVVVAAVSAFWRLIPSQWQLRSLQELSRHLENRPAFARLRLRVAGSIAARLTAAGGCGSCAANSTRKP